MIGIGTDLVDVDRLRRSMQRTAGLRTRLFTEHEQNYAEAAADPYARYAARFAAKEATLKALGVGLGAMAFTQIEVRKAESGQPELVLHAEAQRFAAERGVQRWLLTLSHTDTMAQAVAVAL